MTTVAENRSTLRMKFSDHFDLADNILIELLQILCGYPILLMDCASDLLNIIAAKKVFADAKACDIS
jgi:orotidine-5'-phosphate decarboxylase